MTPARIALGIAYDGAAYHGWQSQPDGRTVQDALERALGCFVHGAPDDDATVPDGARSATEAADADVDVDRVAGPGGAVPRIATTCAGRTDAGVHALQQVVHVDPPVERAPFSWVRGTNRFLPRDIAVQWCRPVGADFHARFEAVGRRYRYLIRQSAVRPALEAGRCGWVFRPLDGAAMQRAADLLLGEHDFTSFRGVQCQAKSPVKTMRAIEVGARGAYWRIDFDASAFLHHMVRNIVACLVAVGSGARPPQWMADVLQARDRQACAPTFAPDGLYFVGPYYDARHGIPERPDGLDWLV